MEKASLKRTVSQLPEKPTDRTRFSIYVSEGTWLRFKTATASVGTSAALELLMEKHLAETGKKRS